MAFVLTQNTVGPTATGATTNTATLAFTNAIGSGNAVMGLIANGGTNTATFLTSVTDDKGNAYTIVNAIVDTASGAACAAFYRTNITNAPKTITGISTANPGFWRFLMEEWSGISSIDTNTALLQINPGSGAPGANILLSNTATIASAGELIWGASLDSSGDAASFAGVGTGFTLSTNGNTADVQYMISERQIQSSASNTQAVFSILGNGGATNWITYLLAFKPSGPAAPTPTVIFLTNTSAGQFWTIPADWNPAANTVAVLAGGGSGGVCASNTGSATGGAGGALAFATNINFGAVNSVHYVVGIGGAGITLTGTNTGTVGNTGGFTWFFNSTTTLLAQPGGGGLYNTAGSNTVPGAVGGPILTSVGTTKNTGGFSGLTSNSGSATGGGGAAGINGAGNSSAALATHNASSAGGSGDAGLGGAGGANTGGAGAAGFEWTAFINGLAGNTAGSGGGGGGHRVATGSANTGGVAGLYGAGSGASIANTSGSNQVASPAGTQGIIVITYQPIHLDFDASIFVLREPLNLSWGW